MQHQNLCAERRCLCIEAGWPAVCLTRWTWSARKRWHSAALVGALPSGAPQGALVRAILLSCRVILCSCHQQLPQDVNPGAWHIRRYKCMTKSEGNPHWRQNNSSKENVIEKAGPAPKSTLQALLSTVCPKVQHQS